MLLKYNKHLNNKTKLEETTWLIQEPFQQSATQKLNSFSYTAPSQKLRSTVHPYCSTASMENSPDEVIFCFSMFRHVTSFKLLFHRFVFLCYKLSSYHGFVVLVIAFFYHRAGIYLKGLMINGFLRFHPL